MAIPLYTLPEGKEYEKYIHPDPNGFDGYSYGGRPWKEMALAEKLAIMIAVAFYLCAIGFGIYYLIKEPPRAACKQTRGPHSTQ